MTIIKFPNQMFIRYCIFALIVLCPAIAPAQKTELTPENISQWREHILPRESELNWLRIPWLTTFADGILAANEADKPLLLWVMNGHPLGCT